VIRRLGIALLFLLGAVSAQAQIGGRSNGNAIPSLATSATAAYRNTNSLFYFGNLTSGNYNLINLNGSGALIQPLSQQTFHKFNLWSFAQSINVTYSYWKVTGSSDALSRLTATWAFIKATYTLGNMQTCGAVANTVSTAQDDAAWGASGIIELYEATGDDVARQYAQAILDCAWTRWQDSTLGGGLWYDDTRTTKASYQAQYALATYQYWQDTADATYHTRALSLESWMVNALFRNGQTITGCSNPAVTSYPVDGLLWIDTQVNGANTYGVSQNCATPNSIALAGSVTLLEGNMAFAVLEARLYNETGTLAYLTRMNLTATGIKTRETVSGNILLDDRDAFDNAFAAYYYANEVVPLLTGPAGTQADKTTLVNTANSVVNNDTCQYFSYGGDWQGPCQGVWYNNQSPNNVNLVEMVSAQGANLIQAGYYASLH